MDDSQGGSVLEVKGPALVKTTTEIRGSIKETFEEAQETLVYVTSNSDPVGAVIGLKHLKLLEEAIEKQETERLAAIAEDRFRRLREGTEELLDENEFWASVPRPRKKRS
jgi:PHD/YefM family antitoxin component YafN of YafNO toxin-antitoxin module